MKDIVFTRKRQCTELIIWGGCFLFSFLLNLFSIIFYGTEWKELYTQLLWVVCLSFFFYFVLLFFRLLYLFVFSLFSSKHRR